MPNPKVEATLNEGDAGGNRVGQGDSPGQPIPPKSGKSSGETGSSKPDEATQQKDKLDKYGNAVGDSGEQEKLQKQEGTKSKL